MVEGKAFERLKVQLAGRLAAIRREKLGLTEPRPIGSFTDELDMARAAWILISGARIELHQTLYRTVVTLWLNDLVIAQESDGCRLYAEAAALVNALSAPLAS